MNTGIFVQVEQAAADYDTLWAAFRESEQQAADITAAVAARIAADKAQADERVATLTAQSRDPARPPVVQRLAQQELNRLKAITFEPSPDEVAAFDAALRDALDALTDARKTSGQLLDLFTAASKKLKELRAGTLGNQ